MPKPDLHHIQQKQRAHILADTASRVLAWCAFAFLAAVFAFPLAWSAFKEEGAIVGALVLALMLGLCAQVAPRGRSLAARYDDEEEAPAHPRDFS